MTAGLVEPYGGRQYGRGSWPVPARRIASASPSSLRMRSALNGPPAHGWVDGEPPPPRARSQWYIVWFAISKRPGLARMIASTCLPCAVSLMTPVAKIVAHTRLATRKSMIATAGSMRPPMSNVSATPGPAFGIVANVWADPADTRFPAVHPLESGEVGGGGAVGRGTGVTPGSPRTRRIQPGSMTFGSVASDG